MSGKVTITRCPHCGQEIHLEALAAHIKRCGAEVARPADTLKAANQLKRSLSSENMANCYCCESAFTVSAEELPSEGAFA